MRSTAAELRHRARLRVDLGGVAPVAIDETRLGQILVNLLINAAHAIAPGHPTTQEVVISAHARGDRVVLEVRDTGCGMAPEVQARIFEPFFTTKPVGVGTGLGLAICHGIVGSVGGDISCESQVGVGTVFRVSLPAATRARTPTAPAAPVAGARGRVLIIDDEPMVLKTMARMLRDHDLTAVASARDALALLRRGERFDVILSDVMMPEMTGMELYEQLLRDAPDVVHQIVFVSGGVLTAKVGAFLASIPNRALAKPILAPELRALTRCLRDQGAMRGAITPAVDDVPGVLARVRAAPRMDGLDLVPRVTCAAPYAWAEPTWRADDDRRAAPPPPVRYHVVAYDFGIKTNILRQLRDVGCRVTVVPATTPAAAALALAPDGFFLSNGPGDPAAVDYAIGAVRALCDSGKPVFGICLGHQILGLALGARTRKLPFGHHGGNHPVLDRTTGKVEITAQNHGFIVDPATLPSGVLATHDNLFDHSNEGIAVDGRPIFSVQYHPEASPGPHDASYLFARFAELLRRAAS